VIVGAGVMGVEMATPWQALGSRVTVLAREEGLLPPMEPFAGELVTERLREAGADVRFNVCVGGAERVGDGEVRVALSDGGEITADEILFATASLLSPETGCTASARSNAELCSPTRASIRPASPASCSPTPRSPPWA
jgi:NADH dehydrogenase FAD-containing subunit